MKVARIVRGPTLQVGKKPRGASKVETEFLEAAAARLPRRLVVVESDAASFDGTLHCDAALVVVECDSAF